LLESGTTPALAKWASSFGSPWTTVSWLASGYNAWGSPPCARSAPMRPLNPRNIASSNAPTPNMHGRHSITFSKNGGCQVTSPLLAVHLAWRICLWKIRWTPSVPEATMSWVSFTLDNRLTFFITSSCTSCGWRGAGRFR
jgi:hypothetical protein